MAAIRDLIARSYPSARRRSKLEFKDPTLLLLREDVGESYDALARAAAAAVGAETCTLALYDAARQEMISRRPRYDAPNRAVPQFRFPLDSSPSSARVVRTGEPYLSNDPSTDPLYDRAAAEHGVNSVLTVPVRGTEGIVGLLYALNKPGGFTPDDVRTLMGLSHAAAITLENIRLFGEERSHRVLNESLREVSRALVGNAPEDTALGTVLDQMWRVVRYEAAAAVVLEGESVRVAATRGGDLSKEIPLGSAEDLRMVLGAHQPGIRSSRGKTVAAPLMAKGEVLGGLVVAFEADHNTDAREVQLVAGFAENTALFLATGRLLRRERQVRTRAAAVARITRMAATRRDAETLLAAAAPEIRALSGVDRVALYEAHPRNAILIPVVAAGATAAEEKRFKEMRLDLSAGPLAPLVQELKPIVLQGDTSLLSSTITPFADTRSLLVIPLVSRGVMQGAVALACVGTPRSFDPVLVEFLHDVAQPIALGLESARLFARLSQIAATDELTQLANRRKFMETLRLEVVRAHRAGTPLSLIMVDVDFLKKINDTYGHQAGDLAIRHVADAIARRRRATDLPARLGGEEFALLLAATDKDAAVLTAERIGREIRHAIVPGVGYVTVSIGVATLPEDANDEEALIRAADRRLYAAKSAGRDRVVHTLVAEAASPAGGEPDSPGAPLSERPTVKMSAIEILTPPEQEPEADSPAAELVVEQEVDSRPAEPVSAPDPDAKPTKQPPEPPTSLTPE